MAGSTTKKAIIRRYHREALAGYVNPVSFLKDTGIDLLSADGLLNTVPFNEIKTVCFVREFEAPSAAERRVFFNRPKTEGLWVSFQFHDGEVLEGVLPNNLIAWEQHGFSVAPPDPFSNVQRVFVPRAALRSAQVLGVVGSPLKRRKGKPPAEGQIGLFDEQPDSGPASTE